MIRSLNLKIYILEKQSILFLNIRYYKAVCCLVQYNFFFNYQNSIIKLIIKFAQMKLKNLPAHLTWI